MSAYDYLHSNPSIAVNGFVAAGVVDAVEGISDMSLGNSQEFDDDPFAGLSDTD